VDPFSQIVELFVTAPKLAVIQGGKAGASPTAGTPGKLQPLALAVGNAVHRFVQIAFVMEHPSHAVLCERRLYFGAPGWRQRTVMDVAVADPAGPPRPNCFTADLVTVDAAFKTVAGGYRRPDILDLQTRELFEIKPEEEATEGLAQLEESILLFNALVASYQVLPAKPAADLLKTVRPIVPGLWIPPRVVYVGLGDVVYAWLQAPGLILYRRGRRRSQRQRRQAAIAQLRVLEQEEQQLVGRLQSNLHFIEVAKDVTMLALLVAMLLGGRSGGATAGEGVAAGGEGAVAGTAAAGEGAAASGSAAGGVAAGEAAAARQAASTAETVAEQASRMRPPRWDYGPTTGTSAQDLAELGAVVASDPTLPQPQPPTVATEGAPTDQPPADEGAFVNELAWELLQRLPCGTAAAEARARLVEQGEPVDLTHVALVSRQESMAQLLLALAAHAGGIGRMVELLMSDARQTPVTPRDLADLIARRRDIVLTLETWDALLTLPDDWIGQLTEEDAPEPPSNP
jgi:hypothetical protein